MLTGIEIKLTPIMIKILEIIKDKKSEIHEYTLFFKIIIRFNIKFNFYFIFCFIFFKNIIN